MSVPSEFGETRPAEPAEIDDSRIATLERRVQHLESELEGFQDAVYRQSAHPDERITELRDKGPAAEQLSRETRSAEKEELRVSPPTRGT